MTKSLNDVEWKEFKLKEITEGCNIAKSKDFGKLQHGKTVFIGRQETNNGVQGFVNVEANEIKNCITVSMVATKMMSFWQKYNFATSQNILILRNQQFNNYNSLFICSILNNHVLKKYDYGKPIKISTFSNEKLILPVTKDGAPDYKFMEEYIKEKEQNLKAKYRKYVQNRINKLEKFISEEKKWKEFEIKDVFETIDNSRQVPTGSYIRKEFLLIGKIPRITVTSKTNGIDKFCTSSDKNFRCYKNFISISFLGDCFYQKNKSSLDMKVHCLRLKNKKLATYSALFLITSLKNNSKTANYGNQLSSKDLPLKKILLPITTNGQPNWEYMENYMKYLEQKKILKYLDFIK